MAVAAEIQTAVLIKQKWDKSNNDAFFYPQLASSLRRLILLNPSRVWGFGAPLDVDGRARRQAL